jgi:hypothetical protein
LIEDGDRPFDKPFDRLRGASGQVTGARRWAIENARLVVGERRWEMGSLAIKRI